MTDSANGGERTPAELAQRWIDTMRSVADQIQRQQQTFQQMMQESMNSYVQLLNNPPSTSPSSHWRTADGPRGRYWIGGWKGVPVCGRGS